MLNFLARFRRERGQAAVEFAIILPALILLTLGIIEFGLVIMSYDTVANAAREGARYGIIHPDDTAGIEAAARTLTAGLVQAAVQVNVDRTASTVEVEVLYNYNFLTAPVIQAVGGNPTIQLRTVSTMLIE